jgi:hypothetical protein
MYAPQSHRRPCRWRAGETRSERMSRQRAARRLRDLGLIELEDRHIRRTGLGERVAQRYWDELQTGRPIRWPAGAPRRGEDPAPLAAHVEGLCDGHGIRWSHRNLQAYATSTTRRIAFPRIRDRKDYFVALHEIAHIVLEHGSPSLRQEREAWNWALEHARVKPTQAVRAMIRRALRSYGDD